MAPITPRWEWRTFGDEFGPAEARIRQHPLQIRRSVETYVVSDNGDTNTKIRDQLLDVKTLRQIDARGLELWQPLIKTPFPLSPAAIDRLFRLWNLRPPSHADAGTPAQFLERVVRPHSSLAVVDVTKERAGCDIDGCVVEIADLTFDGLPTRTIAVEMADSVRVWATVEKLGLSARENVNYVKALKRHLIVHTR